MDQTPEQSAPVNTSKPNKPAGDKPAAGGKPGAGSHLLQAPTGTRDLYPAELNRLRYIQKAWRDTAVAYGFDEIDGPTFEHLDLYTIKSGEGIVSELFSFERFGGEKTFALRPEFTPTLARMYATKAASLPKPTKWFWQQNCFRAERPQRGRLREFWQWNCDIIGTDSGSNEPEALARMDAEIIATCVGMLKAVGLTSKDVRLKLNDRWLLKEVLEKQFGIPIIRQKSVCDFIDRAPKLAPPEADREAKTLLFDWQRFKRTKAAYHFLGFQPEPYIEVASVADASHQSYDDDVREMSLLGMHLRSFGVLDWCDIDLSIARGLAYYTGMVFEVHEASGAERAIAGGGRYDGLIELFGGPPTPAVGFGMGDVVLSLVLKDKGLLPSDEEMAERLGLAPDVVVVSNSTPEGDAQVAPLLAVLRNADLQNEGLHARRSYKSTKNVGKLIQEAVKLRARFCAIVDGSDVVQVKDLKSQEQVGVAMAEVAGHVRRK